MQPQGPPPPQELYQPQGCTYYSPAQQQQQQQQAAPIRRPKAAIPILPPPDNQQSSRGRGRTTQQYQQSNQLGNTDQQIEQDVKISTVGGGEEKAVSGQFDNVQDEQLSTLQVQETQKSQDITSDTAISAVDVDENIDKNTNDDHTHITVVTPTAKQDNVNDSVSVKDLLKTTSSEKNSVSHSPTLANTAETERELGNIDSAIAESTIVEKAAA